MQSPAHLFGMWLISSTIYELIIIIITIIIIIIHIIIW